ncbi:WD repeat-containing protein 36 [Hondaea fermentalgiana]|uniref:WD repeat-containing protein 36 n=1 Tax=Hondaea fermentalgiana TaxID=2315210 RepID=A0A2R5GVP3_9STRA|nr:WD repeat-containing protein 36 [Hondaea fermentalgiana]|eukprot:GBG32733.1 WD repeat-containing protein 36 [Hondaea fermentalgiana]
MSSRLFEAYRTIGVVCDDVPFALNRLGKERFATVSVGKGFMVYDLDKLIVKLVSPPVLKKDITKLACKGDVTFAACGDEIIEWKRAKIARTLLPAGRHGAIVEMSVFGHVLVVICAPGRRANFGTLLVLDMKSGKRVRSLTLGTAGESDNDDNDDNDSNDSESESHESGDEDRSEDDEGADASSGFVPTCVLHPDTYLNKMLVGGADGALELWNIRTGKRVYRFKGFGSPVVCLAQSPAVDVVGIGLQDGRVVVHNLRVDETLMTFTHEGGAVSSVSFRAQGALKAGPKFPMLVSGNATGELAIWDLAEKRMAATVRDAHDGAVVKTCFLPGEPLLVTSGIDNALKVFIFEQEDGRARLLKSRQGHKSPPTRIRYYGGDTVSTLASGADASCCQILSAGRDRAFRVFHTARDQLNRELSQGPLVKRARTLDVKIEELKLPPIVDFAATEARQRDWCNILSAHAGEGAAFTWQLENRVIGKNVLRPDGVEGKLSLRKLNTDKISQRATTIPAALCVAISSCGNFGLVGTADGLVFRYNMQSGLPRGSYPKPSVTHLSKKQQKERRAKRRKLNSSSVRLFPGVDDADDPEDDKPGEFSKLDMLLRNPQRHQGAVQGVSVDAINKTVISAGLDGCIKFWDFAEQELEKVVDVGAPVAQLIAQRDSGMLAVACDDLRVLVIDTTMRRVIRTFAGHKSRITDLAFSNDGRWLATACADTSLRVFDLPSARCIDWMQFPRPVTGLTFAPTGEFLATSFADSVGISLWANRAHFGGVKANAIARRPVRMRLPSPGVGAAGGALVDASDPSMANHESADMGYDSDDAWAYDEADDSGADDDEGIEDMATVPAASTEGEISLSAGVASKWFALAHLDIIKERNKPTQPAEKPEKAPFFLPSTQSVNPVFKANAGEQDAEKGAEDLDELPPMDLAGTGNWGDEDDDAESKGDDQEMADAPAPSMPALDTGSSRIFKGQGFARPRSTLFSLLEEADTRLAAGKSTGNAYAQVVEHLMALSPSAVDFELQSATLGPEDDDGAHLLRVLMDWLLHELQNRTNFEMVQAMMHRLTSVHADSLLVRPELQSRLKSLRDEQAACWKSLKGLVQHNLCLLSLFAHQV